MDVNFKVGNNANTKQADGNGPVGRLGNMNDLIVSELQARYYENTFRKFTFSAASTAAVATTAIAATTYTGLCLSNPVGSPVNLVILKACWAASAVLSAATVLALQSGFNSSTNVTHTTPITPANNFIGIGTTGQGLVDSSATLPTAPTSRIILTQGGTLATTGNGVGSPQYKDIEGAIILPAGAYLSFATSAANTAAWWFGLTWMEIPA